MSAFPSLPLFTDAFIADTGHLSAQETGAYLMLMMVAWRSRECRLPDDDDKLARWARVDRRTWARIKPSVMEFWALADGYWTQGRLSKEREIVSKRAEAARENGKHGGRPKLLKNNEAENPMGSAGVSGSKAPNPNPIEHSGDKPLRGAQKRAKPKTRIEADTQPDERQLADARESGLSIDDLRREWRRFRDHHLKEASAFADWQAAWRNWLDSPIRAREQRSRAGPVQNGHGGRQADFMDLAQHYDRKLREGDDGADPFDLDAAAHAAGGDARNGYLGPPVRQPAGGDLRLPPPSLAGPPRPH